MNRVEFIFKLIDVFGDGYQNPKKVKGVEHVNDVAYGPDETGNKCDFLFKGDTKGQPLLINIHGGGFVMGDKYHRRYICSRFAERGWFVMNVNYRFCPKHQVTAQYEDIWSILQYIPQIAEKYGVDTSKIVLTGDSSGAYMSSYALALLSNPSLRERLGFPDLDVKISGFLGFCGPYDVTEMLTMKIPFGFVRVMAESVTGMKLKKTADVKNYENFDILSVTQYVNDAWPPTCLIYSKKDIFTKGQGELMFKTMTDLGIPVTQYISQHIQDNHCYHFNFWAKACKEALTLSYGYLDAAKEGKLLEFIEESEKARQAKLNAKGKKKAQAAVAPAVAADDATKKED
ncbi:MAG: alpha/beta hydrolase [Christensenellaceae bacterium]|jgi:acetyl esterase/lipase|nr:alpha/beta hydrolase [Christensenellaceae bacterium]